MTNLEIIHRNVAFRRLAETTLVAIDYLRSGFRYAPLDVDLGRRSASWTTKPFLDGLSLNQPLNITGSLLTSNARTSIRLAVQLSKVSAAGS
jgi:hypothetical protein